MARFSPLEIKHKFRTAGQNVHVCDESGESPLHTAVRTGNLVIMKILLEYGAERDAENYDGETALHLAAKSMNFEASKLLLYSGANPNVMDNKGCTPLHYFMQNFNDAQNKPGKTANNTNKLLEIAREMLQSGAYCNIKNSAGRTLLHLAVESQQSDLVEMIMVDAMEKDVARDKFRAKCLMAGAVLMFLGVGIVVKLSPETLTLKKL